MEEARVIIRPSGTEPKLKCYLQTVVPVTGDVQQARDTAQGALQTLRSAMSDLLEL